MKHITQLQVDEFHENGFITLPQYLSIDVVDMLSNQVNLLEQSEYPGHVLEDHGKGYRALHGCHLYNSVFMRLIRSSCFLGPAMAILNDEVYVHQLKINLKKPFHGELWPWHQDYIYWREKDGVPRDSIISAMLFLDDITEFNGPLFIIPKSHKLGSLEPKIGGGSSNWDKDVSADLSFQVDETLVGELVRKNGIYSATGSRGTVLWFHGNIVHASPSNISPFHRRVAIITYNGISNTPPKNREDMRPAFLCARDTAPLTNEIIESL